MVGHVRITSFAGAAAVCLALLLACLPPSARAAIPAGERQVLINLYKSSSGGGWTSNSNWCSGACPGSGTPTFNAAGSECTWFGVDCDAGATHVTAIALPNNNLSGALPDLSALTSLQYFSVVANHLTGPIPSLSALAQLRVFYVDSNALNGSIPSLSALTQLRDFSAQSNQLSGSIPSLAGLTNLQSFLVNGNRLSGAIPSLLGLGNLQDFEAGSNQLTGSIPSLTAATGLLKIVVDHNQLSGTIPSLAAAAGLFHANLGMNRLTGAVPAAAASLYTPLAWAPSVLCANPLTMTASANDAGWEAATGFTPWWQTPHASNLCDEILAGTFE